MSKARLVWEAQKRDAEREIAFERDLRFGRRMDPEEVRAIYADSRLDLAGMAAVFLEAES